MLQLQTNSFTQDHSHVFCAYPNYVSDLVLGKPPRGRQRALTSQEKQEAVVARKAMACWACHLSKIKVRSSISIFYIR
jgi:hypothetical protein